MRNWVKVHLRLHCFKEYFWRHITGFCNPCTACIVQRKKIILGGLMLWAVYRQENLHANICFTWTKPVSITSGSYVTYLRVKHFFLKIERVYFMVKTDCYSWMLETLVFRGSQPLSYFSEDNFLAGWSAIRSW